MENFSMQSETRKRAVGVRALIYEVLVILSVIAIAIFVLDRFGVIHIASYLPWHQTQDNNGTSYDQQLKIYSSRTTLLQKLSDFKKLHQAYSVLEYEGYIGDVDVKGGIAPRLNAPYAFSITLNYDDPSLKDSYKVPYYVGGKYMNRVHVFEKKAGNDIPIKVNDLKPGDKVIIKINTSLMKRYPDFLNELTITRI